ncbi:hypothetical protein [Daejeonella sp. H1SJ63]|jgi:hypothetical protein|uniref:hypothetical protein n=1 Tax=Daejeonella sp. H1SJ63 TaxID=3034145 RepID=UPI0023EB45C5|nr:hypothetical protein [Daejeonella sp. H1SJ63]
MRIISLFLLFSILSISLSAQNKKFEFIAFGDMPYRLPADYTRFETLIKQVNKEKPAFSVHVGDFKSGSTLCSDEYFNKIHGYFETFSQPLIYTPGDNEWTDCNREAAGSYNPLERLSTLRKLFFSNTKSFGKKKMELNTQAEDPAFSEYVENLSWEYGGVQFATIHLVGSNNNFRPGGDNTEFLGREKANLAWIDEVYRRAADKKGLVFFTQADMFNGGKIAPVFQEICNKLSELSRKYDKPVLWVNGDSHRFIVDKPLLNPDKRSTILNFTRLQVFGDADMASVRISVDPKSKELFTVRQLLMD